MSDAPRLIADRYRLESVLGRGGMGRVWLARDETLGRQVAVKEVRLPTDLDDEQREALRERMLREARLTAGLSHRGVVTVYDVVSEDGHPFIVMELVRAPNLAEQIDRKGPLAPQRAAAIGLQLLDALDTAHRDGIVHRDVKPSNVLLAADRVVLTDFGIALSESDPRMTTTGLLVGSPTYMSPERMRGQQTGPPADMWSLGATLYAAVEGRPPFRSDTTMGTVSAVLTEDLPEPSAGGPIRDALVGLLDKDPDRRFTAEQVGPLLRDAARDPDPPVGEPPPEADPVPAAGVHTTVLRAHPEPPEGSSDGTGSGSRRRPGIAVLGLALTVLVVLAVAVLGAVLLGDEDEQSPTAAGSDEPTSDPASPDPTSGEEPTAEDTTTEDSTTEDSTASETTDPPSTQDTTASSTDVPKGYRLHRDQLDFQVAVPRGWERRLDGPSRVDFVSPDGSTFLRVDQVADAGPDAEGAWLEAEETVSQRLPGYERIRIEPVDYRSWEAADWEFTFEGDNGTVHVLDRGIITDPRGFALYVSSPDSSWESDGRPVFEAAAESFRPL